MYRELAASAGWVLCNRDEKRSRGIAVGPRAREREGIRFLAPADFDARGSWLAVNEYGISLCLLNGGAAERPPSRSRGMLVSDMAHVHSLDHGVELLSRTGLLPYAPFSLLILQPQREALIAHWDGEHLGFLPNAESHKPLTSSSVDPEGARRDRRREYGMRPRTNAADLYQFHSSRSACVHRSDAETVSFSWVIVAGREVRFFYSPAAPCKWGPGEQITVPRAA